MMIRFIGKSLFEIRRAAAAALVTLVLTGCGGGGLDGSGVRSIYVAWQPHPDPAVTGYTIFYGPTIDTATVVASSQPVDDPNFDPLAPSVRFNSEGDLGLHTGETVCFRLKAYSSDGESGFSPGTCTEV